MIAAVQHHNDTAGTIGAVIAIVFAVILYVVPTIVAWVRRVPHAMSITIINVLAGWTFIGWVVALAMATRSGHLRNTVTGERP